MKKILIIDGHPNNESFCSALRESYKKGAMGAQVELKEIIIRDLKFNPNLEKGYAAPMDFEPDLQEAWEKILWAEHIVWIHPVWWGGMPAICKGFIDRVFRPGFAFKMHAGGASWDKLLSGRTGHIITTMGAPAWYHRFFVGAPGVTQLKTATLEFCGVKPVKVTYIGGISPASTPEYRQSWLSKVEQLGKSAK
jgi:NAD(P)H dehydrogenase (quinone)